LGARSRLLERYRAVQWWRYKIPAFERFDRAVQPDWIIRLPQEDFCQVLGNFAAGKYESQGGPGMAAILDRLRGSASALEAQEAEAANDAE